jgi:hypothetical protein
LHAEGSAPLSGTPAQLRQFIELEHARWGGVVRDSGAKAD